METSDIFLIVSLAYCALCFVLMTIRACLLYREMKRDEQPLPWVPTRAEAAEAPV